VGDRERDVDIDATEFAGDAAPDCRRPRCGGIALDWTLDVEGRMLGGRIAFFFAGTPAAGRGMPAIWTRRYRLADHGSEAGNFWGFFLWLECAAYCLCSGGVLVRGGCGALWAAGVEV